MGLFHQNAIARQCPGYVLMGRPSTGHKMLYLIKIEFPLPLNSALWNSGEGRACTELVEVMGVLSSLTPNPTKGGHIMARDEAYYQAEKKIEKNKNSRAIQLDLISMKLTELPESLGKLTQVYFLNLSDNQLTNLPGSLRRLTQLQQLNISNNQLMALPESLSNLKQLRGLFSYANKLTYLPQWLAKLTQLEELILFDNQITDLPSSLAQLKSLQKLNLDGNPLNPELAAAYKEGLSSVIVYLRAKAASQIILNEAKLILIGEGEVGKTCLLSALRGDAWEENRPTTHGIEIKPVQLTDAESQTKLTLNGWDFGGQRVYRPTHQLFFSAPAVYIVVWKPREGPQQGFVKEWIQLVKRREPDAKILVVATHGGLQQRQPDIDRQELYDLFGRETVLDFFFVESKPDESSQRRGIADLQAAIARVAASLPEVGRSVPKSFQDVWLALRDTGAAYLPFEHVLTICHKHKMDDEVARLFVSISHRLGHLIHYAHDPALRDIVVLKPSWLATAISYVLDDEVTRNAHGLVRLSRLSQLWNDPTREAESRYGADLHPIFLRLMERFDLSYRVAEPVPSGRGAAMLRPYADDPLSLIAQLVPDNRPEANLTREWPALPAAGDAQQAQICRIVDRQTGQSAGAEGLFYQLIVRLHRYSLGREDYKASVHWQRGLVLDDDYNGRALLEHTGNEIRITVRAAYPERLLAMLTGEVKYLVESFWEGLRCDVMVPCIQPCGRLDPGLGLFEVDKLIDSKRKARPEYPCPVCDEWQDIDHLLRNAPAAQPDVTALIFAEFAEVKAQIEKVRKQGIYQTNEIHITGNVTQSNILIGNANSIGRFDHLDAQIRRTLSRVDKTYSDLLQVLTDEAKEGPRLFSFEPVNRSAFHPKQWTSAKFRLTLWCEHSRQPLPLLNGNSKKGVYEIELTRAWFQKAAPFLKVLVGTLSLVLPVAVSGIKLAIDESAYKAIENQLDFGKELIDSSLGAGEKTIDWLAAGENADLEHGSSLIRVQGGPLRELQALLKAKDPSFGGLVRVLNKRQEFLWVHEQFASEY